MFINVGAHRGLGSPSAVVTDSCDKGAGTSARVIHTHNHRAISPAGKLNFYKANRKRGCSGEGCDLDRTAHLHEEIKQTNKHVTAHSLTVSIKQCTEIRTCNHVKLEGMPQPLEAKGGRASKGWGCV